MSFNRPDLDPSTQMNVRAYENISCFTSYAVKCNGATSENVYRSVPAVKGEEAAAVQPTLRPFSNQLIDKVSREFNTFVHHQDFFT